MSTPFTRRIASIGLALSCAASLPLAGCASVETSRGSSVGFKVTTTSSSLATSPVQVGAVRVLTHHVNLQEPVAIAASEGKVDVTLALRHQHGVTMAMDAESLALRTAKPYAYAAHPKRDVPPYAVPETSRLALDGGASLAVWTEEDSGRVLAQLFDGDGSMRGDAAVISLPAMVAFGAPRAATPDGRRVVVTFFVLDEDGFALAAASLDTKP